MIGAAGVYRWLLLAYPAGFRERYGRDMVQLFEDRRAETRTRGEGFAQWGRTVWDSVSQGLSERWLVLLTRAADAKEAVRQAWAGEPKGQSPDPLWQRTIRDLRYAARALRKKPAFTVIAVATLALGIGANTAMFSVVNGVLLKPLPFPESDRLVFLTDDIGISIPDVAEWRKESATLESIGAGTRVWDFDITGDRPPERIVGSTLEAQYFDVLQVRPLLGRVFTEEEDQVGGAWVAVISEAFWQHWFGGDSAVIGRTIILSDNPTTVIGVMPHAFDYLELGTDLWVPVAVGTPWAPTQRGSGHLHAIGRLKPGVSLEAARTEMEAITAAIEEAFPRPNAGLISHPVPLLEYLNGDQRLVLFTLLAAVAMVLLVACVNIANLFLVKAAAGRGEIAVRLAIGATRSTIVRQALAESALVAAMGAATGLVLAVVGTTTLGSLVFEGLWRAGSIGVDLRVLVFTLLVTVGVALFFGLLPGGWSARTNPASVMHESGGGVAGSRHRLFGALVVAEVALSFLLLIGAGLMLRSLRALEGVDPGFNAANVLTADVSLPPARYGDSDNQTMFFTSVVEQLNLLPGVEAAASVIGPPLKRGYIGHSVIFEGREPVAQGEEPGARNRPVVGDYFRAMGIPMVRGRAFADEDGFGSGLVAIVNERFAQEYWPDQDPVGTRIAWLIDRTPRWMTVVGVAKDVKTYDLRGEDSRAVYTLYEQRTAVWQRFGSLIIRSHLAPAALTEAVRQAVNDIDPLVPIANVVTMAELKRGSLARERFVARLLGLFAAVALLMALQGVYGVLAFAVEQRKREIGIRMALGAQPGHLLRSVVGRGVGLAGIGILFGVVGAVGLSRLIVGLLYGVGASDPVSYLGAAGSIALIALAASALPALRATRADPVRVLKAE